MRNSQKFSRENEKTDSANATVEHFPLSEKTKILGILWTVDWM